MFDAVFSLILGYVLGSFPSAYLAGRFRKGIDIREVGSKNMGAMNVIYETGLTWGILVALLDAFKGIGAIFLARLLNTPQVVQLSAGLAAVVGHTLPVFLSFRGGKGGATALGILIFLMPAAFPYYLALLGISMFFTRNLTFGYSTAFISFPIIGWLIYHSGVMVAFSLILILWLVINNIPGFRKMRREGWRRAFLRRSLKDRRV